MAVQNPLFGILDKKKRKDAAVCSATHVLDDTGLGEGGIFLRMHLHNVLGPESSYLATCQQPVSF
ncbi:hypothetical protein HPB48_011532 [Haemaphysalis longicornis]|uniref:Uncharacterized protein n=1 Tax=Haemaphysalis longicornis TaxID=44386 RepID=A0A9J6GHQ0_HAELO|nr:hypothetical protein HPB48_011532 [Haemaphysalis longicornis]